MDVQSARAGAWRVGRRRSDGGWAIGMGLCLLPLASGDWSPEVETVLCFSGTLGGGGLGNNVMSLQTE